MSEQLKKNQATPLSTQLPVQWFTFSGEEALAQVHSTREGLNAKEVLKRQQQYGRNSLPQAKPRTWLTIVGQQINSPLVYVLLVAAGVSFLLDEQVDATVIFAAVCIQVLVGFIQEFRAQQSLAALKQVISLEARVLRDEVEQTIPVEEIVPGDIIFLQAGDKISADVRVLEVQDCEVNESALTGESEPVAKQTAKLHDPELSIGDRTNLAYTGTVVTKGQAVGVVFAIGAETEIGHIAQLIKDTKEEVTPLQGKLIRFSRKISIWVVVMAIGIFAFGYFTGGEVEKMFTIAVAVAVSAIPEGLAVAVTIILAVGMRRILKQKALVRKLVAAETLGSTDVICTDKTGTLTEGNMQMTDFVSWERNIDVNGDHKVDEAGHEFELGAKTFMFALRLGMLCNDAKVANPNDELQHWKISGNLTERALLYAGRQGGLHISTLQKEAPRIDEIPFDSSIKYMATLHREAQGKMLYVKGAPEIVGEMCTRVMVDSKSVHYDDEKRAKFEEKFIELSKRGLRIIAVAYKNVDDSAKSDVERNAKTVEDAGLSNLTFVGYIGIKDPLRAEAKSTIAKCQAAGIKTVMITGDHKLTAQTIAKELGLEFHANNVIEGFELDAMSEHELNKRVTEIMVYARVTPEHKLRIVNAWQHAGMVVAMTGDGINDSPAIKAADIGVALGSGTDVAKETADIVILDNNFGTIVAAVEEGRGIFDNIKKTVLYLLSDSFSEAILIVGALLMGLPIPITAAQILWINLIDDSFPSLAMTQEPKEPESMKEPPRGRKADILDKEVKTLILIISGVTGFMNLGLFYYIYHSTGDIDLARTVIFLSLGVDSLLYMFSVRSMRKMIYQKSLFSNKWLIGAFFAGLLFQIIPIYVPFFQKYINTVPLGVYEWGIVLGMSVIVLIVIEAVKYLFLHVMARDRAGAPVHV